VSIDSSPKDLVRSIFEGLAYASFESLNALNSVFGVDIKKILAVGGPTRNRLLMEIKAALATAPFCVVEIEEAACRGAAILAGLGIGLYRSADDIRQLVNFKEKPVEFATGWADVYRKRFDSVFRSIYPAVRDLQQQIIALESRTGQNAALSSHD